jgi:hypothetical protein
MKFRLQTLVMATLALATTAAIAGSPVSGSGPTKASAADDADRRARVESERRFKRSTCYTPAKIESCQKDKDSGYYQCRAYVANHQGSCR